jgi:hypothetical protein
MNDIVWQGQMGPAGKRYDVEVVRLADSAFRGVMHVFDSEGEVLYQKEVPISDPATGLGGIGGVVSVTWSKTFENWLQNYS